MVTTSEAGDDQGEVADYWIPSHEQQGLLEVMRHGGGCEVPLHARYVLELKGNFFDYTGGYLDLSIPLFVEGKAAALKAQTGAMHDKALYSVHTVSDALLQSTSTSYIIVRYRDWSPWATTHYWQQAKGGFGSPNPNSLFGITLNPFQRSYVDKHFAVVVNKDPGYFKPLTPSQFAAGVIKSHENSLNGKDFLTEEQFDEIMSREEEVQPTGGLGWALTPMVDRWDAGQRAFGVAAVLVSAMGFARGISVGPALLQTSSSEAQASGSGVDRVKGFLGAVAWMGIGFLASAAGSLCAMQGTALSADAPLTALSAGMFSICASTVPSATRTHLLAFFTLVAAAANYRLAALRLSAAPS